MKLFHQSSLFSVLVVAMVLVGCDGSSDFGPTSAPGGGGTGGSLDLTGTWYESPHPSDWPETSCTAGVDFGFCLAGRLDLVQSGDTVTGTHLCYDTGEMSEINATLTSSSSGTVVQTDCDGALGCWRATYDIRGRSDGAVVWEPVNVVFESGPWAGAECSGRGAGLAYREARTAPVVAGLYDYVLVYEGGPCAACDDGFTNVFYVLQDEERVTGVIPDTASGRLVYEGSLDSGGRASYTLISATAPGCGSFSDRGLLIFTAGRVDGSGTVTCDGCACDYTTVGIRR